MKASDQTDSAFNNGEPHEQKPFVQDVQMLPPVPSWRLMSLGRVADPTEDPTEQFPF